MPAENVEVVRRFIAAMSAGPEEVRASAAEFWDADVDYYPARKYPEAQPSHGLEEISQLLVRVREPWSRYEGAIREVIEVDDERVLAHMTMQAEGRESGVSLEGDLYQCYWLRHGRFLRVEDHLTLKRALHALGLEGETLEAAGLRGPTNLDVVRSIWAVWETGDYSSVDWAHPDIEFVIADGPEPGRWTGVAGMAEGFRGFLRAWQGLGGKAEEYRELDDERVLVLFQRRGRGKASGLELEQMRAKGATVFDVRDGRVTRLLHYLDYERALADLGLASADSPHT